MYSWFVQFSLLACLGLSLIVPSLSYASDPSKDQALSYLKDMKAQNTNRLVEIDAQIRNLMGEMQKQSQTQSQSASFEQEISRLSEERSEHLLRQDFIDRLLFQVNDKYSGTDIKGFLERVCKEMSVNEATSSQSSGNLWKFLSYLSLAIKNMADANESVLSFVEGYMKFSTLKNPIRPDAYGEQKSYSNGLETQKAKGVDIENIGEVTERQLHHSQKSAIEQESQKLNFELRRPILKAPVKEYETSQ